ncbi:DLW-39 family protein [Geodermatophilus sp. YIM 151500]|uniref:DLW-39 family protein n=1 Tax=Geodermatophilus sp. YIM 151500 TaxID=2984531 RepID=UPI0021E49438|nr:DLW-39 family protein [Geodermatophilus sp. YIM 151500]MCV2491244.1 DLW-39 family protein [Geodermatophilus sp. YIM 151500]
MLKKLALAAAAAGALAVVRRRTSAKGEADLWHEATRGPDAVSTPTPMTPTR